MKITSFHRSMSFLIFAGMAIGVSAGELENGNNFLKARNRLLGQKWQPVDLHRHDQYEFLGVEKILRRRKIPEVESCAMDRAICIFNYRKGQQCLRIFTQGEQVDDMQIVHWSTDCAPQDPD